MLRRTKIVATLGPASDETDKLCAMIEAGLDVATLASISLVLDRSPEGVIFLDEIGFAEPIPQLP